MFELARYWPMLRFSSLAPTIEMRTKGRRLWEILSSICDAGFRWIWAPAPAPAAYLFDRCGPRVSSSSESSAVLAHTLSASLEPEKTDETVQHSRLAADAPSHRDMPSNSVASPDTADDLAAALEFKFLLPLLKSGAKDPQPEDIRPIDRESPQDDREACTLKVYEKVAASIRAAGESVSIQPILKSDDPEDMARFHWQQQEKRLWETDWIVKKANSAVPLSKEQAHEKRGYLWVPVEVTSPKLKIRSDPGNADADGRVSRVLSALNARFRLVSNGSCEVHVHLGRMDDKEFTLPTLKRLGTLLWLSEEPLRSIRDPRSPNFANIYTWGFPNRVDSRLAIWLSSVEPMVLAAIEDDRVNIPDSQVMEVVGSLRGRASREVAAVDEIWKCIDSEALGKLLSGEDKKHRRLGFNFSSFGLEDARARRKPRTVEIRIMEGFIETPMVLSWFKICQTIAEVAVARSDRRFVNALCCRLGELGAATNAKESPGVCNGRQFRELMEALGVPEDIFGVFETKIKDEYEYPRDAKIHLERSS